MEIKPTYLIFVSADNHNKYYNLFPEGNQFKVQYGRVDSTKTERYYPISKWDSQIKSKLKKATKMLLTLRQISFKKSPLLTLKILIKKLKMSLLEQLLKNFRI